MDFSSSVSLSKLGGNELYKKYNFMCTQHKQEHPYTKHPLFQRNGLTRSRHHTFESFVKGKAL